MRDLFLSMIVNGKRNCCRPNYISAPKWIIFAATNRPRAIAIVEKITNNEFESVEDRILRSTDTAWTDIRSLIIDLLDLISWMHSHNQAHGAISPRSLFIDKISKRVQLLEKSAL